MPHPPGSDETVHGRRSAEGWSAYSPAFFWSRWVRHKTCPFLRRRSLRRRSTARRSCPRPELCPARNPKRSCRSLFPAPAASTLPFNDMPQRMSVVVFYHLRITGGAGGEVNQHQIVCLCAGCLRWDVQTLWRTSSTSSRGNWLQPSWRAAHHESLCWMLGPEGCASFHPAPGHTLVVQTYHGVDLCAVSTINQILFRQLQRAGNQNAPILCSATAAYPVFPSGTAPDEHNHWPFRMPRR